MVGSGQMMTNKDMFGFQDRFETSGLETIVEGGLDMVVFDRVTPTGKHRVGSQGIAICVYGPDQTRFSGVIPRIC